MFEERKAKRREIVVKLLLESLKAKRERDWKAKEEAEKDLPKSECAQGSTSSIEEPEEKKEEQAQQKRKRVEKLYADLEETKDPREYLSKLVPGLFPGEEEKRGARRKDRLRHSRSAKIVGSVQF